VDVLIQVMMAEQAGGHLDPAADAVTGLQERAA